jgi:4-hydroxy-tetrahydrodipicolinate synthase
MAAFFDACPNAVAVKYAVPDPLRFAAIVREVGPERVTWICGLAESWAPFYWAGGATGFTSGLANVAPRLSLRMLAALRANDLPAAMAIWALTKPFEDLRARDDSAHNVSTVKEALAQQGICSRVVRPPGSAPSAADREAVAAVLRGWEAA